MSQDQGTENPVHRPGDGLGPRARSEPKTKKEIWIRNKKRTTKCENKFFIVIQSTITIDPWSSPPSFPYLIYEK
jgi:hypothetical protein